MLLWVRRVLNPRKHGANFLRFGYSPQGKDCLAGAEGIELSDVNIEPVSSGYEGKMWKLAPDFGYYLSSVIWAGESANGAFEKLIPMVLFHFETVVS